jgi:hypothetical protein
MSLRVFHIIFVIVCVGLSVCVGVWGIRGWMQERSVGALALGIIFLLSGLVLVLYGTRVFAKLRDLP